MKIKKIVLLLTSLLLIICVLTGCGAKINTELSITKDFSGQRKIDVIIENDDLSENVTGGINALKAVADSKIPKEMSCVLTAVDGGSCLTFTIDFKNIDDYRNKIVAIISAGSNEELMPEIEYENLNTVFKKGVKLDENFTSFDLLQWYFDAVKAANIITYDDTSDWYEIGDSKIIVDTVEYDSGSELSIDEQELCCLENIEVKTILNIDGTFSREFKFLAYDSTVEELSEKGCNLSSYISKLALEGDTYSENTSESLNEYIITVKAADAKQLVERTNKILQTSNDFSIKIQLNEQKTGNANIKIEEKLDGSFYLDYDNDSPLRSTIELFDNCSLKQTGENDVTVNNDVLKYYPSSASKYSFDLDWKISFSSIEIVSDISSNDKARIDFVFTSEETLQEDLKKSAIEALKTCCGENGEFKENGDVATISFSGSIEELNDKINSFIQYNDTKQVEGKSYFEINFSKSETSSNFTNAYTGDITYDLSPIIGNTRILFNDVDGLFADYYYQGNFETDEDGNKTVSSNGNVSFTLVKLSLIIIILLVVSCIVLIFGSVLIVVKRKEISNIISEIKAKKKVAIEKKEETITATQTDNELAGVCVSTNVENNSVETETEEELL